MGYWRKYKAPDGDHGSSVDIGRELQILFKAAYLSLVVRRQVYTLMSYNHFPLFAATVARVIWRSAKLLA